MDFIVNVNSPVKVKLTESGVSVLKQRHNDLNIAIKLTGGKGFGDFELITDEKGYASFQMWSLMQIFGDLMSLGFDPPFETEIIVTEGTVIEEQS